MEARLYAQVHHVANNNNEHEASVVADAAATGRDEDRNDSVNPNNSGTSRSFSKRYWGDGEISVHRSQQYNYQNPQKQHQHNTKQQFERHETNPKTPPNSLQDGKDKEENYISISDTGGNRVGK